MSRSASRRRAEDAYLDHLDGYSWAEIADRLGFRSRQGAQTAVRRWLADTTPDPASIERRKWIDGKKSDRAKLKRARDSATGDPYAIAQLSAAIDRIDDQLAKAQGFYAPAQQNVNVSVSPSPVESWRQQMLDRAAVAQRPALAAPVLDTEVVE